jgi:hypothetical protein
MHAVFVFDGISNWVFRAKLTAAPLYSATPRLFGCAVAIFDNTIVVGAKHYDTAEDKPDAGQAFVFVRSGTPSAGTWSLQANLTANDSSINSEFGHAVDIWGDRIVVGAPKDVGYTADIYGKGATYVFDRLGDVWAQSQKLVAPYNYSAHDRFGACVGVSPEFIVGGNTGTLTTSRANIFVFGFNTTTSSWAWVQRIQAMYWLGPAPVNQTKAYSFATSCAISNQTLIIGAPDTNYNPYSGETWGAAYIYDRNASTAATLAPFQYTQELRGAYADINAKFGTSVDIVGDRAIVGSPLWGCFCGPLFTQPDWATSRSGAAVTFRRNGSAWDVAEFHVPARPLGIASTSGFRFGTSVALDNSVGPNSPGTMLVGASSANSSAGLAFARLTA